MIRRPPTKLCDMPIIILTVIMNTRLKFTLTQISALIPAIAGIFISLFASRSFIDFNDRPSEFPVVQVGLFIIIFMTSVFLLFKFWAWILVQSNILTKEEAKGYPYSKPWED